MPTHHQVAVVPWSGEETKTSADHLFVVVKRIGETQPRLNIAVVGRVQLADNAHIGRRRKDIEVIAKAQS